MDGAGSDSVGHYVRTGSGTRPFLLLLLLLWITVLGGTNPLPKLSSTVLGPAIYVSRSLRSCSLDLPQLTQGTSTQVFLK